MIYLRHKSFRKYQEELAKDIYNAIDNKKIFLAEAPTGMGKTDASISASIEFVLENNLTLFFLTPKISQHSVAEQVVKGINKKYDLALRFIDVIGRRYMCIHPSLINADYDNFYSACEQLRKHEICNFYNKFYKETKFKNIEINATNHKTVYEYGEKEGICPYELLIQEAKKASIIAADYFHIFSPKVRNAFLYKTKKSIEKSIIIVDEAHNLPSRLRSILSSTITSKLLDKADKELSMLGYEKLKLKSIIKPILKEGEILFNKFELYDAIKDYYEPESLIDYLKDTGTEFIERTARKSALLKIANFLEKLSEALEDNAAIMITNKDKNHFKIKQKYLDPGKLADIMNKAYASILMSGTLRPLYMYLDVLSLNKEKAIAKAYKSPFPKENKIIVVGKGLTTKYSRRNEIEYRRYADVIKKIVDNSPKGIAIFFPSYEVMDNIATFFDFPYLKQKQRSNPNETMQLIERFKKKPSILLGVQGGSLSEGIDFNNGEIKTIIIVGIALDEMNIETKAIIDYYDEKFGKGWDYGYIYPAIIKALQAAGRAIRKENDRAAIVLLDERFNWKNYKALINERMVITEKPWEHVKRFFS